MSKSATHDGILQVILPKWANFGDFLSSRSDIRAPAKWLFGSILAIFQWKSANMAIFDPLKLKMSKSPTHDGILQVILPKWANFGDFLSSRSDIRAPAKWLFGSILAIF